MLLLCRDIGRVHFIALALPSLLVLLLNLSPSALVTELVGSAVLGAGLFVQSYLMKYLQLVRSGADTRIAYWLLAAFLILCAAIMLVREYILISGERNYFNEAGESE